MTSGIIEKKMKKALNRFAGNEQKGADSIQLFIHTKNEELLPEYFYAVDGVPKQGEDGKPQALHFVKEILGVPFDALGHEAMAQTFLKSYFQTLCDEEEMEAKEIYVMITAQDEKAETLQLALYKGNQVIRMLELNELFGD